MSSTYHRDYPDLYPTWDARALPGLSFLNAAHVRHVATKVADRTGTRGFYNPVTGKVLWVYGTEPVGGPLGVKFKYQSGEFRRYADHQIDQFVEYINLGKMDPRVKDHIAKSTEMMEASDREQEQGRYLDGHRRESENYAGFLSRKRRGTGTLVSV